MPKITELDSLAQADVVIATDVVPVADVSAAATKKVTPDALVKAVISGLTVNTVSPSAPNRTITVSIGGTTYYIHAKTTND